MVIINKKNRKINGYTLLEVMLAVSIALAITGWAVVNTREMVLKQKSHAAAIGLFKELQALPPLALKNDCQYFVQFDDVNNTYKIYKDSNNDTIVDGGEEQSILSKPEIKIAIPSPPPSAPPSGSGFSGSAKFYGQWLSSGSKSKMLIISNDNLNTINNGAIYLQNSQLPKQGYCIYLKANSRTLKLFFWDGSSWIDL